VTGALWDRAEVGRPAPPRHVADPPKHMVKGLGGGSRFDGVKVFTSSLAHEREVLGERVTAWLRAEKCDVVEIKVAQSSDSAYHCLTIMVFYRFTGRPGPRT